jgi:hypothetical protein
MMSDQATAAEEHPTSRDADIEDLARETGTPIALVHKLYRAEHAKLDQVARIKTYVPVLIRRHVKELLQTTHAGSLDASPRIEEEDAPEPRRRFLARLTEPA